MNGPLVSVVMPVFNAEQFVGDALRNGRIHRDIVSNGTCNLLMPGRREIVLEQKRPFRSVSQHSDDLQIEAPVYWIVGIGRFKRSCCLL